jgi:hypothetical protein
LQTFEDQLQAKLQPLDASYPDPASLDAAGRGQVIAVAAWVHSEWVRIHPFANGNGRTARMWANLILLRYGMPPVMRLRPRPSGPDKSEYADAAQAGMKGNDRPAQAYIRRKYDEAVRASVASRVEPVNSVRARRAATKPSTKKPVTKKAK